jgi:hypothetical protein
MQRLPSDLLEVDWELLGASNVVHRPPPHWYPAIGRREVAGVLIGCLSPLAGSVLDPFCGSGTIMAESLRLGRHPLGGDVNPVGSLVTTARLTAIDAREWERYVSALRQRITDSIVSATFRSNSAVVQVPQFDENRHWYHAATLTELGVIWNAIHETTSPFQLIAQAAFSSILRQSSSRRGPANRIADNIHPNVLVYRNTVESFFLQLDIYRADKRAEQHVSLPSAEEAQDGIWAGPSESILPSLDGASVDLVVTRIPEPGAVDHVRSQRLSYLWFQWDMSRAEAYEIGARYKHRRSQARQEYLQGIESVFAEVVRVLKPGGWLAAILGPTVHKQELTTELASMLGRLTCTTIFKLGGRMPDRHNIPGPSRREEILIAHKEP